MDAQELAPILNQQRHSELLARLNPEVPISEYRHEHFFAGKKVHGVVLHRTLPQGSEEKGLGFVRPVWTKEHQGKYVLLAVPESHNIEDLFAKNIPHVVTAKTKQYHSGDTQLGTMALDARRTVVIEQKDCGLDFAAWQFLLGHSKGQPLQNPWFFLAFVKHLLEALYQFHKAGYIHCDLKRDNLCIMLAQSPIDNGSHWVFKLDLRKISVIDLQYTLPDEGRRLYSTSSDIAGGRTSYLFPAKFKDLPEIVSGQNKVKIDLDGLYISPNYVAAACRYAGLELTASHALIRAKAERDELALQRLDWGIDFYSIGTWLEQWLKTIPLQSPTASQALMNFANALPAKLKAFDTPQPKARDTLPHLDLIGEILPHLIGHQIDEWHIEIPIALPEAIAKQPTHMAAETTDVHEVFEPPSDSEFVRLLGEVDERAQDQLDVVPNEATLAELSHTVSEIDSRPHADNRLTAGDKQVKGLPEVKNLPEYTVMEDYHVYPNGTAVNPKTGLQWMRASLGQVWDEGAWLHGTNLKKAGDYSYWKAKWAIAILNRKGGFAGFNDWRLPTIRELHTLMTDKTYLRFHHYFDLKDGSPPLETFCPTDTAPLDRSLWTEGVFFGPKKSTATYLSTTRDSSSSKQNPITLSFRYGWLKEYNGPEHVRLVRHTVSPAQTSVDQSVFGRYLLSMKTVFVSLGLALMAWLLWVNAPQVMRGDYLPEWLISDKLKTSATDALHGFSQNAKFKATLTLPKTQWVIGEPLQFKVTTSNAGFLTLLVKGSSNADNELSLPILNVPIQAGTHEFPHAFLQAQWLTQGPVGQAHLLVVVTPTPIDWASADGNTLKALPFKSAADVKALFVCKQGSTSCDAEKSYANYAASSMQTLEIVEASKPTTPPVAAAAPAVVATPTQQIIDGYEILDDPVLGKGSLARDPKTGLVWQRCSVGQTWNGSTCTGEVKAFNSDDTQKLVVSGRRVPSVRELSDTQKFAGNGWRVPSVRELSSLIYCSNGKTRGSQNLKDGGALLVYWCDGDYARPTIRQVAFPKTESIYEASPPYVGYSGNTWVVDFDSGFVASVSPKGGSYVRLVR